MEILFDETKFTALFADLLRPMTGEERALLKESIQEDGIKTPILIDETNGIIDGINRLSLAAELDLHPVEVPIKVMAGLSMEEKRRVALSLNTARRHLTGEEIRQARTNAEKREDVEAALKAHPEKSDRAIAAEVGVSHNFVNQTRKALSSDDSQPTARTGRDGRTINVTNIGKKPAPVPASDDPPPLPESEALEYPDPDEDEDDTEPGQSEDDLADDDEPDTRAPICEGCGEPDVYCHCGDQADELIDGSKFIYDVSLGKWVPRAEALEAPPSEEVRQLRSERTAQREATRLGSLERRAAEVSDVTTPAAWEIRLGDCIKGMSEIAAGSVRLAFADSPYNLNVDYGPTTDDCRSPADFMAWVEEWFRGVHRVLSPDGTFWVMISDEYAAEFCVALKSIGFTLRNWVVWYETFGVNCSRKFNRTKRHLLYAVKDADRFVFNADAVSRPSDRQSKYNDPRAADGGKNLDDVWLDIPRLAGTHHERIPTFPTQLPLKLLTRIVACSSDPGDLVLDPFSGSGTTCLAAVNLKRRFIGFEVSESFATLSRTRILAEGPRHA